MAKLLRITTVPESLRTLLKGQLAYMRANGFEVYVASAPDTSAADLEGCPHFALPLTRRITPFQDLWAVWKTYRLLRRLRPDLVHTHTPKAGLVGMVAAWLARVPVRIHTVAGLPLTEKKPLLRMLLRWVEKLTYGCATAVWPNSHGLAAYIGQHVYNGPKLRVIGNGSSNGIDTEYFSPTPVLVRRAEALRRQLTIPPEAFVFVFIGRMVRDKGLDELVVAFRSLVYLNRDVRLLFVGDYEERLNPVRSVTKELISTHPHISWVGYQADVRPYLQLADALVLPSYREGLPNVLLQAGCMQRPVIATDIVGCRDVVEPGKTGLLVPPKDPVALRGALRQLLTNPELGEQMGQNARHRIETLYRQETLWQTLLQAYQDALAAT